MHILNKYVSQLESAGGTIAARPTKLSELTEVSQFPACNI